MDIYSELRQVAEEIHNVENIDDLRYVLCKISFIFEKQDLEKIDVNGFGNTFFDILEAVFNNAVFNNNIEKIVRKLIKREDCQSDESFLDMIDQDVHDDRFITEKKEIKLFLNICFFPIVLFLGKLSETDIRNLRFKLVTLSKEIERKMNYKINYGTMMVDFCGIITSSKFSYNSTFPLKRLGVKMGEQLDSKFLFGINQKSIPISVLSLISVPYFKFISTSLKTTSLNTTLGIFNKLNTLYGASAISEKRIEKQLEYFESYGGDKSDIARYTENFRTPNEEIIGYIIDKITSGFYDEDIDFDVKILDKIELATNLKDEIVSYCSGKLSAFNDLKNKKNEWSNKIFIITIQLLSVFEIIQKSNDVEWKRSTAVRSLNVRLENFNKIVNKYELIDDWDEIKDFVLEENNHVERKTNFFTPVEQKFESAKIDKKVGEIMFDKIINTMIGMMNTDGGIIVIGLCEHPDRIVRDNIKENVIKKNNFVFYDVYKELSDIGRDSDVLKRHIQDKIKSKTHLGIDQTDNYWNLLSVELIDDKDEEKKVTIFKITIKKSENLIPLKDLNNEKIAINLIKRVDSRTIFVDPSIYLRDK